MTKEELYTIGADLENAKATLNKLRKMDRKAMTPRERVDHDIAMSTAEYREQDLYDKYLEGKWQIVREALGVSE